MKSQIFINLPVKDLAKAMAFYTQIGFTNNPQFTDETAACMVFSEEIFVMLLTHDKFKNFIVKEIADTSKTCAVINSLSLESVTKMNEMADKAVQAGAVEYSDAKDYGFMQQRSFEDLDGHCWEVFFMDMSKFPKQ
ncbi:lactoylglutathione lyase [Flavobacterium enshiense DK69]|uniref:Extradiol dioxygenase n=1 Tax=Flavobacterium enshiense DK69 TaxID=1107311 RepID=V6S842_9FLAO|nr:lactoylglutathione lyase [Flavobacterium enshiense]ESU22858.1 lactoylglutathione lyase [Flavobacterium enshiense DK69]KGO93990.1 extradiol dioxygenase [Flavobacterium enshiense DK69]